MQQDREGAIKAQQLDPVDQRRLKPPAPAEHALNCPRCDSTNTKFCYYNNYSQSQPRHFCKNCRRYWTRGGALRNVPVGGGCRKNKRPKQRISTEQQQQQQQQSPSTLPKQSSSNVFYNLPHLANQLDLSAFPASQPAACSSAMFPDVTTSCQLPSFSHHLPSLGSLQHLRNSFMGLDFNGIVRPEQALQVGDQLGTFLESSSLHLAPPSAAAPSEGFRPRLDAFNEIDPIAKLALGLEESQMMDGHVLAGFQAEEDQQPVERLRQSFMPIKVEQESPSSTDWHGEQQPGFYGQAPDSSFWNNAPTWPNLNPYSTSASPLL